MKRRDHSISRLALCCFAVLAATWSVPALAVVPADGDTVLFYDDFDGFSPGTLPPDWHIVWSGAGHDLQKVSDLQSFSGTSSFQLVGQPYWSGVAERSIQSDSAEIGYEFKILIDSYGRWGEEHPAFFSYQAEGNRWGTYYAAVRFDHRRRAILAEDGTFLGKWSPRTWYSVRVILDRNTNTYDVWIDGAQVGFDLPIKAQSPKLINAIALISGHAGVPVYYDDVAVFTPGGDTDGDGIPDSIDPCPEVNPGLIDLNVDGCVDNTLVIAAYLKEGLSPVANQLPDAALDCAEGAVINLEIEALQTAVGDMLCVAENLEVVGTQEALEAGLVTGVCAQTTALLAIDQAAQIVGPNDPNVIAATTLVELGIDLLNQLEIPQAVKNFFDAVSQLFEAPEPSILVEIKRRSSHLFIWEKYTYTFATWGEQIIYPIRVTNTGNVDLSDVRVNQTFSDFREDVGDLAVGESVVLNVGSILEMTEYRPKQFDPDPFLMVSTGVGNYEGQWVINSAVAEVDIIHPAIKLEVEAPDEAKAGELISVSATVTNTGDVTLHGVYFFFQAGIRDWDRIGDLAPGESRSYFYHYLVPDTPGKRVRFLAYTGGGRDFDTGFSWTSLGKRIRDVDWKYMTIIE